MNTGVKLSTNLQGGDGIEVIEGTKGIVVQRKAVIDGSVALSGATKAGGDLAGVVPSSQIGEVIYGSTVGNPPIPIPTSGTPNSTSVGSVQIPAGRWLVFGRMFLTSENSPAGNFQAFVSRSATAVNMDVNVVGFNVPDPIPESRVRYEYWGATPTGTGFYQFTIPLAAFPYYSSATTTLFMHAYVRQGTANLGATAWGELTAVRIS